MDPDFRQDDDPKIMDRALQSGGFNRALAHPYNRGSVTPFCPMYLPARSA